LVDESDAEYSDPDEGTIIQIRKGSSCPFKNGKAG